MEALETVHLSSKDLICPICYHKFGLSSFHPISLNCGHNLCSQCLKRVRTCPLCRSKIYDRASYAKNVFISYILEQKERLKECKIHNRPIEFFCKDHKQLLCVDCGIEGNHFAHNFIKCKEIENKTDKMKSLMKKIDSKDEESRKKFKGFLEIEKKNIKRRLDEILDEYIEPIINLKKKLRKEIDVYAITQGIFFEKDVPRESLLKWRKDSESLVATWEANGEGEAAAQIVDNEADEIEKRISKYEARGEKIEADTQNRTNMLLKEIKSKMNLIKSPWKKLNRRLGQVVNTIASDIDPKLEREYLVEYLKEYEIPVAWIEQEGEEVLEVKGSGKEASLKDFQEKYFDCTMRKVRMSCYKVQPLHFQILCKVIETISKLTDLKMLIQDISDQEVITLGESLMKIKGLERLNLVILSETVSEKSFNNLWSCIHSLPKLKVLDLTLEDLEQTFQNALFKPDKLEMNTIGKMKQLKEINLRLVDCDPISNESLGQVFQHLQGLTQITKFSLSVVECKELNYKLFEYLCRLLPSLTSLKELSLAFEGFYELSNLESMLALSNAISNVNNLRKLELSFADSGHFLSPVIRKFFNRIALQAPGIKELHIDLSRCREVVNGTIDSLGSSIAQLSQLNKLSIIFKMCSISERGMVLFSGHLSRLNNLKSLFVDCRHCKMMDATSQFRALAHLNKLTKPTEKEFLFGEGKQDMNHQRQGNQDEQGMQENTNIDDTISFGEREISENDDIFEEELEEEYPYEEEHEEEEEEDDFNEDDEFYEDTRAPNRRPRRNMVIEDEDFEEFEDEDSDN